ncbi:MAG: hypothetical protein Ct9H300mP14_07520 [Gammaproteobacteria bacterium]|nr:MAG: hypothetical protein Ct9H300mP14_07520 [Gammaproteobacteria bacterium]
MASQNNGGSEIQEQRRGFNDSFSRADLTIHKSLQEIDSTVGTVLSPGTHPPYVMNF